MQKCGAVYANGVQAGAAAQRSTTLTHLLTYSLLSLAGVIAARRGRGLDRRRTHPAPGAPAHRSCPRGK